MAESDYKIIFTGLAGAGKTAAIGSLNGSKPQKIKIKASDITGNKKSQIIAEVDYAELELEDGSKVCLYEMQGEDLFALDDVLIPEIGLVLMIDNTQKEPIKELKVFLNAIRKVIVQANIVIGITRMDLVKKPTIEEYRTELKAMSFNPALFEVDARQKNDVSLLVQALLYTIDPSLQ